MKHPLWVLTQQEQDKEAANNYACGYLSLIKDDDWIASLYRAVEYRCFFGTMTICEIYNEEEYMKKIASKGDYIVHLGRDFIKGFIFMELVNETTLSRIYYIHFDSCLDRMTRQGLHKQFDRGKGLIFAKTARNRAIPAIQCWLIISKRLRVVRDIRILIAKRLWANRHTWVT